MTVFSLLGLSLFLSASSAILAAPACQEVLKLIHAIADSTENAENRNLNLNEIFEAFAHGLNPELSNQDQRLAFEAYLKMAFGSPHVNISQPQGENPVDLVGDFQENFPHIRKPKFLSLILDSKPKVKIQKSGSPFFDLREHISKLKTLQAKFLKAEANIGFWKSLFDQKDESNEDFLRGLEEKLKTFSFADIQNLKRLEPDLAAELFEILELQWKRSDDKPETKKKLARALVDLVHLSSLLNENLTLAVESKNEASVLEQLQKSLRIRDEFSKKLGFENGFDQLSSHFKIEIPSGLKSKRSLLDMAQKLRSPFESDEKFSNETSKRRLRQLSMIESPFRSCVGNDCSSRESFSEAFDPNYVYFTITDERNRSSGLFTVVLGEAMFQGKSIPVAFLDKIQNLSLLDLESGLDALRETLAADGIKLIAATDLGDHNGLSNDEPIKVFLGSSAWLSDQSVKNFEPHHHSHSFKHVHTRARKNFDWRFVEPLRAGRRFAVYEGSARKNIFQGDFAFDQVLRPIFELKNDSELENRMRYIPSMQSLARAGVAIDPQFEETLELWVKSEDVSFKLKKQAMIYWLETDKDKFFKKLELLNQPEQIDLIQNVLDTPRHRAYLFQTQREWGAFLYLFRENRAIREHLLRGVESNDADLYLDWLAKSDMSLEEFLSLIRFRSFDLSFLNREELEVVKKHLGVELIQDELLKFDSEGQAMIHKAAKFSNSDVFEFLAAELSDTDFLRLLRLPQKDGKKTIHLLAESIRPETFEILIIKKERDFWVPLLLEPEFNESGRTTSHILSQKNQIEILESLSSRLNEEEFFDLLKAQDSKANHALHLAAIMGHLEVFEFVKKQIGIEKLKLLLETRNLENKNVAETAAQYMRSAVIHWVHGSL